MAGWSQAKDDRACAEKEALSGCSHCGKACVLMTAFNKQCRGLAGDGRVAVAADQQTALQQTRQACTRNGRRCVVQVLFCSRRLGRRKCRSKASPPRRDDFCKHVPRQPSPVIQNQSSNSSLVAPRPLPYAQDMASHASGCSLWRPVRFGPLSEPGADSSICGTGP